MSALLYPPFPFGFVVGRIFVVFVVVVLENLGVGCNFFLGPVFECLFLSKIESG